ncbi:hypothetical protein [Micromonospora vulcania]|uniref:Lipoprotein n=1 Tax=Micromonospora vulcania TaxID=1441873 RepID=A0ABW1H4C5_9ACTN
MRGRLLTGVTLGLTFVAGCTTPIDRSNGEAAPAGSSAPSATPTATSTPSAAVTPSSGPSASNTASSRPGAPTTAPTRTLSEIRRTDWRDVTIRSLGFCGESDGSVTFRNGSNGFDVPCRILPGGARPVYAEFLVEEPANAPSTEDALVLVELGNTDAARQQALVPVQLADDGRTRSAWPVIKGDPSSASGDRAMTFLSYRVLSGHVEAIVRRLDGRTETRRWRQVDYGGNWERF